MPHSDFLVLCGDFNARVGRRDAENDLWSGVLGKNAFDDVNEASEEFLELCV